MDMNDEIYVWGSNAFGELGIGNTTAHQLFPLKCQGKWPGNVVDIKCGSHHTLVLTSNQEVFSCGRNSEGQLGVSINNYFSASLQKIENLPEITRIECGNSHSLCIDYNNSLYVFGNNEFGQLGLGSTDYKDEQKIELPLKHPILSSIIDISKGGNQVFVKTTENKIFGFGKNSDFQLGIKTGYTQNIPIQLVQGNESIWCSNFVKIKAKSARSVAK